jgi:hypothetical protein
MEYKNKTKDRVGSLATTNLHWERSLNVVFSPCQLRVIPCSPVCVSRLCN